MNSRSFSIVRLIAAAFTALAFVSAPAVAQSKFGSVPSQGTGSFGGFSIDASGSFGGMGGGNVVKGLGEIKAGSTGFAQLESTLNGVSNGCPGGCEQVGATFKGAVGQQTLVQGTAAGPGAAWLNTQGNSVTGLKFRFSGQ